MRVEGLGVCVKCDARRCAFFRVRDRSFYAGFLIYYILPLALLSSNFALLLNIFFFIILGMLLGCVHPHS